MAILFGSETPCKNTSGLEEWNKCFNERTALASKIEVSQAPKSKEFYPLQTNDIRPVFFGTSTSVGMSITWSGMAAVIPEGFHFGYRRKELALAPVSMSVGSNSTSKYIGTPSLIATIDSDFKAGSPRETKLKWIQYFATGRAASALALQQDVRTAMLRRLDPQQLPQLLPGDLNASRISLLGNTYDYINEQAGAGNEKGKTLVAKLDKMGDLVPTSYQFANRAFPTADPPLDLIVVNDQGSPIEFSATGYSRFHTYLSRLDSSLGKVVIALAESFSGTIDGKPRAEKVAQLKAEQQTMILLRQQLNAEIRISPVIQEAIYFYLTNPD